VEREGPYGVHREVVADAVAPAGAGGGAFLSVFDEPLVDLLQGHGVVRCAHQGAVDEFCVGLFGFGLVVVGCGVFLCSFFDFARGDIWQ